MGFITARPRKEKKVTIGSDYKGSGEIGGPYTRERRRITDIRTVDPGKGASLTHSKVKGTFGLTDAGIRKSTRSLMFADLTRGKNAIFPNDQPRNTLRR